MTLLNGKVPHTVPVQIVAGKDAAEAETQLRSGLDLKGQVASFEEGFSAFLGTHGLEDFLAGTGSWSAPEVP